MYLKKRKYTYIGKMLLHDVEVILQATDRSLP